MKPRSDYKQWTKEDYKYILDNWLTKSNQQFADHLGVSLTQIISVVHDLRKQGFDLPSKSRNGTKLKIYDELKKEYNK